MNDDYNERYSRQLILPGFGETAQAKLTRGAVLVIGAGGLGCPALQYLTAAGVGTIGIADGDTVALSNLQRQVVYTKESIGRPKVEVAIEQLSKLNPQTVFRPYSCYLDQSNLLMAIGQFDVVIDGTDNFSTRYMINDACVLAGKPLIHGSVSGFEGQLAVFNYGPGARTNYRDLFPNMPAEGEIGNCEERGVLGVLPGIIGTMQAAEAIKIIAGTGTPLANILLTFNLLRNEWLQVKIGRDKRSPENLPHDENDFRNRDYGCAVTCLNEYTDISPGEFDRMIKATDVVVIDVREKDEQPLVTGFDHINIPLTVLKNQAKSYHNRSIVLFCHSGIRSVTAAGYFPPGNTLYNLKGGIIKWLNRQTVNQKP